MQRQQVSASEVRVKGGDESSADLASWKRQLLSLSLSLACKPQTLTDCPLLSLASSTRQLSHLRSFLCPHPQSRLPRQRRREQTGSQLCVVEADAIEK